MKRSIVLEAVFVVAALTVSGDGHADTHPRPTPNVVLIVADDLGWNDVGYHGSEIRTPNIDRIARQGIELDRFYAYPVCSPTRAALMTGRFALRTGVTRPITGATDGGLPLDERLLPEIFREAVLAILGLRAIHSGVLAVLGALVVTWAVWRSLAMLRRLRARSVLPVPGT